MKKELQEKLFKKYPKIFADINKSPQETCMCWGIETGDGWYKLIDNLCSQLQAETDSGKNGQVIANQIKEKYGTLRFYASNASATQDLMIDNACQLSEQTCEKCGSTSEVSQSSGWIVTLCKDCMKEYRNKRLG